MTEIVIKFNQVESENGDTRPELVVQVNKISFDSGDIKIVIGDLITKSKEKILPEKTIANVISESYIKQTDVPDIDEQTNVKQTDGVDTWDEYIKQTALDPDVIDSHNKYVTELNGDKIDNRPIHVPDVNQEELNMYFMEEMFISKEQNIDDVNSRPFIKKIEKGVNKIVKQKRRALDQKICDDQTKNSRIDMLADNLLLINHLTNQDEFVFGDELQKSIAKKYEHEKNKIILKKNIVNSLCATDRNKQTDEELELQEYFAEEIASQDQEETLDLDYIRTTAEKINNGRLGLRKQQILEANLGENTKQWISDIIVNDIIEADKGPSTYGPSRVADSIEVISGRRYRRMRHKGISIKYLNDNITKEKEEIYTADMIKENLPDDLNNEVREQYADELMKNYCDGEIFVDNQEIVANDMLDEFLTEEIKNNEQEAEPTDETITEQKNNLEQYNEMHSRRANNAYSYFIQTRDKGIENRLSEEYIKKNPAMESRQYY